MKMPKLIQINTVSNFGSTGKIMEAIGLISQEFGWQAKIATGGRYKNPSALESYQISSIKENYLSALHSLLTDRHGFANRVETKRFVAWLQSEAPDIIHLHNIHSYVLNIEILFSFLKQSNIPVIWTLHDCWPFTGHCSHFIDVNCNRWQTGCHDCPKRTVFPKSVLFDNSKRNYADKKRIFNGLNNLHIVTVSKWLGDCARKSFLGSYPVTVIANGVDLNIFKPRPSNKKAEYSLEGRKILMGVSTDWCKAKGLEDFIQLRSQLPDQYAIVLVGVRAKQVQELSETGIICVERTDSEEELAHWYNAADVVLNISYAETFGLPIAEGYACGKPAVVYDNTALSELITPDVGFKVPTGNINELVFAIQAITDKGLDKFVAPCRERAENLYDKEKNYMKYIQLYDNYLKK